MGLYTSSRRSAARLAATPAERASLPPLPAGNPDPDRYTIITHAYEARHLILMLAYDGCTNYEGRKLLMFAEGVRLEDLTDQDDGIDPHFSDDPDHHYPIARFQPTPAGWAMAIACAKMYALVDPCGCSTRCGDDGDTEGPGVCKGLPLDRASAGW